MMRKPDRYLDITPARTTLCFKGYAAAGTVSEVLLTLRLPVYPTSIGSVSKPHRLKLFNPRQKEEIMTNISTKNNQYGP